MKTAISLPDETFERASGRAIDLKMSRSEFFARAAERYLDELDGESLTNQIDASLDVVEGAGDDGDVAAWAGRRTLAALGDEW